MITILECDYRCVGADKRSKEKHYHENTIEFIQIIHSSGSILVHNKLYPMLDGAIYCIDSENIHCTLPENPTTYCRNKLSVPKSELEPILASLGQEGILDEILKKCVFIQSDENKYKSNEIFRALYQNQQAGFTSSLLILQLCSFCISQNNVKIKNTNSYIDTALEYINNHLSGDFSQEDMCRKLHISQSHLCHLFKKELRMTITEYLYEQRMIYAIAMLKNTNKPVGIIAEECGFKSIEHFSKRFRKETGLSPLKYRKALAYPAD